MKVKLLPLFLLLALPLGAETVQIGSGNLTNQSLPIEAWQTYSYSQQLYYSGEIAASGFITGIALQYHVIGNLFAGNSTGWQVWLGTSRRDLLDAWVPLDSLTLVWDGVLGVNQFSGGLPGDGWLSIPLNQPFFYDGECNLVLAVDENAAGSSSMGDEFLCTASSLSRGILCYSMTENPDPASPPAAGTLFRATYSNLRLDLDVVSYPPGLPVPADNAAGVSLSADLQWQSDASSFDVWLGTAPDALQQVSWGQTQTVWSPVEPWQMLQTYHWQVVAHAPLGDYPGPVWTFTAAGEGIGPPQNLTAYYATDHVNLAWDAPATGTPVLYRVFRNGLFLAATDATSWQDYEVSAGQILYYYIKGENSLGELSAPSNTATVHIPDTIPDLILQEGFEACEAFSDYIPGWTVTDGDGGPTWTWANTDFPGEGAPHGWIPFFPEQTLPPLAGLAAHTGAGMLASLSSTQPPNNDWLISPSIHLGESGSFSLWARSHTAAYGLERLRVLISSAGTQPEDFTPLSPEPWVLVPIQWTEYSYDLAAYAGQSVRLAIQCVSWDAFALYVDDLLLQGLNGYVPVGDALAPSIGFRVYPNPCPGAFTVSSSAKTPFGLALYDLRGRKLFSAETGGEFRSQEILPDLPSGIYLLRLSSPGRSEFRRLAVIR